MNMSYAPLDQAVPRVPCDTSWRIPPPPGRDVKACPSRWRAFVISRLHNRQRADELVEHAIAWHSAHPPGTIGHKIEENQANGGRRAGTGWTIADRPCAAELAGHSAKTLISRAI